MVISNKENLTGIAISTKVLILDGKASKSKLVEAISIIKIGTVISLLLS